MRILLTALTVAATGSVLVACAGSGELSSDAQTYAALEAKCQAQGGRFVTTGRLTGQPGLDNACKNFTPLPGGRGGPASSRDAG